MRTTLKRQRSLGFGSAENTEKAYDTMRENIMEEVKRTFRPEFLNRVDEIIVFHALEQPEIDQIARLMMRSVEKRLAERGIRLTVDEDALKLISAAGYDLQYGARPLRRAIQRMVEDALSEEILMGHIRLGDEVRGVNRDWRTEVRTRAPAGNRPRVTIKNVPLPQKNGRGASFVSRPGKWNPECASSRCSCARNRFPRSGNGTHTGNCPSGR